ncbi:hypothetical protein [Butyricicoccus porcorum]|uniref:hypothetical protein n=1 Tax=Butyricicoccus porcorum TaxID=1945634 RepID=UPI003F4A995B
MKSDTSATTVSNGKITAVETDIATITAKISNMTFSTAHLIFSDLTKELLQLGPVGILSRIALVLENPATDI